MLAGRTVHEAIEMALLAFHDGRELPVEPFIRDVIERMRGEWRQSRAGLYREEPKTTALFEHEYRVLLKAEVWQALSRNVATCLRNFFRLPLLATIRRTTPEHWSIRALVEVVRVRGHAHLDGARLRLLDGRRRRLALVDWKTGAPIRRHRVPARLLRALHSRGPGCAAGRWICTRPTSVSRWSRRSPGTTSGCTRSPSACACPSAR